MQTLFPYITPTETYRFSVSDIHSIYVEECGNREGVPVVLLHGGPGMGCGPYLRRFFDAERFRVILIDQRGAGRSQPLGCTADNTTDALISDIEVVRKELGVNQWVVFGYDWGATLGVLYSQCHSDAVLGVIAQGVMLAGQSDVDWLFKEGCCRIFPDAWDDFTSLLSADERKDVLGSYSVKLNSDNELVQIQSAKAWAHWVSRCSTLHPNQSVVDHYLSPHVAIALAKLQCHYFSNNGFLANAGILPGMKKLSGVPGILIHGRYDLISPLDVAMGVHYEWEGSEIRIIRDAGHSIAEPAIIDALIDSTNQLFGKVVPRLA